MSEQAGPEAAVWQIWMPGADRSYAAAHDWIHQTIAAGKTLCLPDEETRNGLARTRKQPAGPATSKPS